MAGHAYWRAVKLPRLGLCGLAVLVSYLVFWNTSLVTAHNLGTRDGIGFLNGGKVFRLSGTMWYHIPGLADIGLAPQNLGGQINLRNNEFALLEHELTALESTEIDFSLEANSQLLVVLDRHGEGTFWAVRLTAFEHAGTPFVNALLRFERGRVAQRIPLEELGAQSGVGRHTVRVALTDAALTVTLDGKEAQRPFETRSLRPKLALGCGELNAVVHRWSVRGTLDGGVALDFDERFSIAATLGRATGGIAWLALFAWLLLIVAPVAKAVVDTRGPPVELILRMLLLPAPRAVFAATCLVPWMPLLLQWVLAGLYVFFVWLTALEILRDGRAYRLPEARPGRLVGLAAAFGLLALAATSWGLASARLESPVGVETTDKAAARTLAEAGGRALTLGERVSLQVTDTSEPVHLRAVVTLRPGEAARADLLQSAPLILGDVFQVDRSKDHPEDVEREDPNAVEQGADPGGYSLRAYSLILSTDPELPGTARYLHNDKVERSARSTFTLEPGTHEVELVAWGRFGVALVNGRIVDWRGDLERTFAPRAAQVLSMTRTVDRASAALHTGKSAALELVAGAAFDAEWLLACAFVLLVFGLVVLGALPLLPSGRSPKGLGALLLRVARATVLVGAFAGVYLAARQGNELIDPDWEVPTGIVALAAAAFNLRQLLRENGGDAAPLRRGLLRWAAILGVLLLGFEALFGLYPERRFNATHYWHHGLGPRWYYQYDPMVLRLNPWFIDQRFKGRDFVATHEGKARVVVFGGSQTFGWGIPAMDRATFSDQLERYLKRRGHSEVEVLNAAFPGVKTATGLRWFASNLLRYDPDVVVVNFVVNEFMNVDQFHVWSGERPNDEPISRFAVGALPEQWRGTVMGNHLSQIIVADLYEVFAMEDYLRWLVEIAHSRGVKVVFSIEPTNLYVESAGAAIMRSEGPNQGAKAIYERVGAALGVPVYDALPHFLEQPENVWFYDTMHMSRLGHKVFAEHLAELIATRFLEPPAPSAPSH